MKKILLTLAVMGLAVFAFADEAAEPVTVESVDAAVKATQANMDWLWTLIAAFLVFFMQLGFAMVEVGFTRAKNAVNIIMKNLMDFAFGSIAYWAVGFGLMFGATKTGFFGTEGFFLNSWDMVDNWTLVFWMFQVVFCATAATIVSGAIAERANFTGYLVFTFIMSAVIYPIVLLS